MSTRCQVRVNGLYQNSVTLYHHSDGYPSNMLPLFVKAYELSGKGWEAARGGKAASFLCAVDPGEFEPEIGHDLHGDIAYYYVIDCGKKGDENTGSLPRWKIQVYTVPFRKDPIKFQPTFYVDDVEKITELIQLDEKVYGV